MEEPTEVESDVIDVDDIEEGENEACLVGRLVSEKLWNPSNLTEAIKDSWKPKYVMSLREWGELKLLTFRFGDATERDWVLKHQPWVFQDSLFAIKKFTGGNEQQPVDVTIEHASFWARLYDVPISCMNERSLRLFANQIGILESMDKSDEDSIGKFIRFKISLNITKPLLRGITIRVKKKHMWLPLKYESLPSYCYSCGTIGHDRKNCQSFNRNLKYRTYNLKASSTERVEKIEQDTPTAIPHDVIENILSRVPVKDLIKFKVVSKQWVATISDPRFAEIHLQQYKMSVSRNLLAWEFYCNQGIDVAKFQNRRFHFVSEIDFSSEYRSHGRVLCNCDGLYLKWCYSFDGEEKDFYVLWNPSCRGSKKFSCPQPINELVAIERLHGIYYNPLMKEYKVVIADRNHYAVFSSAYNKWSEVKEIGSISSIMSAPCGSGVSCSGSFYWLCNKSVSEKIVFGIICFDGKDEKFKELAMQDLDGQYHLTSSGGHLYLSNINYNIPASSRGQLYWFNNNYNNPELRIMKKVGGDENCSWMEFKVQLDMPYPFPKCWLSEDEVMVGNEIVQLGTNNPNLMLYNLKKGTHEIIYSGRFRDEGSPAPYLENLFVQ